MATQKVKTASLRYGDSRLELTQSNKQAALRYTSGKKMRDSNLVTQEKVRDFELVQSDDDDMDTHLDRLRQQPDVSVGTHVWTVDEHENNPLIPTGYLYIEFQPDTAYEVERAVLDGLQLNIREVIGPDAYRVCVTSNSPNPVKCAMILQEHAHISVAEPEFMTKPITNFFAMPSGAFVDTQWHLENRGVQIPVIDLDNSVYSAAHFRRGADAKVKQAWNFLQSLGNPNLKIAVIDTGFAADHPQLRGNGSKLRNPFNAVNRSTDVAPWYQLEDQSWGVFDHGTSCAAVAAGAHDQTGVMGSAPESRLILIKLDVLSDDAIVKAFEHALLNGADVISCSIGFPKPVPLSTWVRNTISKVARQGRRGQGIPICIAAGNANPASNNQPRLVSDFAAHPDVICVSASNSLDEPSSYAFYGPNVFLCAPSNGNQGVGITTATVYLGQDGQTLELSYTSNFGGTSSATPLTAGVCALMISANPDVSLSQLRYILKNTVDKIGDPSEYDENGHSQTMGFGRLNALKAVQMAAQLAQPEPDEPAPDAPDSAEPHAQVLRGKVNNAFLNVRSGPGTNFPKIRQLQGGTLVDLLEKLPGWWRIGSDAYVSADYIQVLIPSHDEDDTTVSNATRRARVVSPTLNVRSGPSTNFAKVAVLNQGALVSILNTNAEGWHQIGPNQWVLGKYVQMV